MPRARQVLLSLVRSSYSAANGSSLLNLASEELSPCAPAFPRNRQCVHLRNPILSCRTCVCAARRQGSPLPSISIFLLPLGGAARLSHVDPGICAVIYFRWGGKICRCWNITRKQGFAAAFRAKSGPSGDAGSRQKTAIPCWLSSPHVMQILAGGSATETQQEGGHPIPTVHDSNCEGIGARWPKSLRALRAAPGCQRRLPLLSAWPSHGPARITWLSMGRFATAGARLTR
jgi:hypothetical protein